MLLNCSTRLRMRGKSGFTGGVHRSCRLDESTNFEELRNRATPHRFQQRLPLGIPSYLGRFYETKPTSVALSTG